MLDFDVETRISLDAALRHPLLRQGRDKPLSRATIERWRTRGVRAEDGKRVVLETFLLGGRRYTTVEAIRRFVGKQNGSQNTPSPAQIRREHERAEAELAAAGI